MGARDVIGGIAVDVLYEAELAFDALSVACLRRGLHAILVNGDADVAEALIGSLDRDICRQLDAILHAPRFRELEAAWRGLKYLVDRTFFEENIKVEILNCSKDDLFADFEDAPRVPHSGMYKCTYSAEYGPFGGRPYGVVASLYSFGSEPQDVQLLQYCASVAAMNALPFLAGAQPSLLGRSTFQEVDEVGADESAPSLGAWRAFRATEDARFVALVAGRCLARTVHEGAPPADGGFSYRETAKASDLPYFNGSVAIAASIARSFARLRLGTDIAGPIGGRVEGLAGTEGLAALHDDAIQIAADYHESRGDMRIASTLRVGATPVDTMLSARRRDELARSGVVWFGLDPSCGPYVPAAPTCRSVNGRADGLGLAVDPDIENDVASLLLVGRFVHYIKVLQREQIGTWKERADLEQELLDWLRQYQMPEGDEVLVSQRPLRDARLRVTDVPGNAGWYHIAIAVRPSWPIGGKHRTLAVVNKLDKE